MSAGLRGAASVRRVRRVECGGEREWVCRLVMLTLDQRQRLRVREISLLEEVGSREDVFRLAMFGVDERFGLRVAVHGDAASAVERRFTGLSDRASCDTQGSRDDRRRWHGAADQWTLLTSKV